MAIVEMTKAEVIEAIRSERLTALEWVSERGDAPPSESCSFCAVGAVVRRAMADDAAATSVAHMAGRAAEWSIPMDALSDVFEDAVAADPDEIRNVPAAQLEAGRAAAIAFVESAEFPDSIAIDLGTAAPRPGMNVVG